MESSTPQRGRRITFMNESLHQISPLKRAVNINAINAQLDESNDDAERQERRKSVATRRSIQAIPCAESPAINDSVRGLSDDDLKRQLQTVCKLNAENKISTGNAWLLRIIDVLKQIVSKSNPDILKVAGNSLEIAGKVYGLRVDDLHAEGLRLAGSLTRNFASKNKDDGDEQVENLELDGEGEANELEKNKKKQTKPKKKFPLLGDNKPTISSDPKAHMDTLPKLESTTFSFTTDPTISTTGNLFTNRVRMDPMGYYFMFASKEKAWNWNTNNDLSVKDNTNKKISFEKISLKNYDICRAFKEFRVDSWDPDQETNDSFRKKSVSEDIILENNGVPVPDLDESIHDVFAEQCDVELNDDDMVEEEIRNPLIHQEVEHIVNFRPAEQSVSGVSERSAYSFNSVIETCGGKIDMIWAGPSHWKLKFNRGSRIIYSGTDKNEDKENNKRGQKRKKEFVPIDMTNLKPPKEIIKTNMKPKKRKSVILDEEKLTMPLLDSSCGNLLENIEYLITIPTMKPATKSNKKSQNCCDYNVPVYNFNNPSDDDDCPQQRFNDDNGEDLGDDIFANDDHDENMSENLCVKKFMDTNLVDAPQMVELNYMQYVTKAKKMDMKKLKQVTWRILTKKEEYDEAAQVTPIDFLDLYKELQNRLPENMVVELSVPIAFIGLLHLCNEQNLTLVKKLNNLTDFGVVGPRTKSLLT